MKIWLVHPRPTRGGFSAVVAQAKELLSLGGFEVTVLVQDGPRVKDLPAEAEVRLIRRPLASLRGLIDFYLEVRRSNPDIVHLHGRQAGIIGRIALLAIPSVHVLYTPHGTPWCAQSFLRALLTDLSERMLLFRASRILCVSRSEQADWIKRDDSDRVVYFPNFVDNGPNGLLGGTRQKETFVLVPGGYNPQKRLEVVIEALALVADGNFKVVFCGAVDDVRYRSGLVRMAEDLGVIERVTFEGRVDNVSQLMACADKVVLSSYSEGMPIVGQEAILAGANVIWSAIPPHSELFGDFGGSFWTASELAVLLQMPGESFSVSGRSAWLNSSLANARDLRADFWRRFYAGGESFG